MSNRKKRVIPVVISAPGETPDREIELFVRRAVKEFLVSYDWEFYYKTFKLIRVEKAYQ